MCIRDSFFHKTGTVYAPYVGEGKPPVQDRGNPLYTSEGGKAVLVGDPIAHPDASWERDYLEPGGDYFTVTYSGTSFLDDMGSGYCGLTVSDQMMLTDFYLHGHDTVWNKKQELSAWAVGYMGSPC